MNDYLTTTYVSDLLDARDSAELSWSTVRALEVAGQQTELLPDPSFTLWALANAAKARRQELSELWPAGSLFRPMIAMGSVVHAPSLSTITAPRTVSTRTLGRDMAAR